MGYGLSKVKHINENSHFRLRECLCFLGAGGCQLLPRAWWRASQWSTSSLSWRARPSLQVEEPGLPMWTPFTKESQSRRPGGRGSMDQAHLPRCLARRVSLDPQDFQTHLSVLQSIVHTLFLLTNKQSKFQTGTFPDTWFQV